MLSQKIMSAVAQVYFQTSCYSVSLDRAGSHFAALKLHLISIGFNVEVMSALTRLRGSGP